MLTYLKIHNLILIEACEIEFHRGLNILSGETGAGKTALLEAISLVIGERADSSSIRHGMEKASVEAAFDLVDSPRVLQLLEESGIEQHPEELLILRREIARQGRSRAFINCQMVPLPLLQKVGALLIDRVGQHSHQELRTSEAQRLLLDLFAGLNEKVRLFSLSWEKEKELQAKLTRLREETNRKERALEIFQQEKQELEEAHLQKGEEEKLFEEHHRMASIQEITEKTLLVQEIIHTLPATLSKAKQLSDQIAGIDPTFQECTTLLQESLLNLKEAAHFLDPYLSRLEYNPNRFAFLEERLKLLDRLKRKYGNPLTYLEELKEQCARLENLDTTIETTEAALKAAVEETSCLARQLTEKRQESAKILQTALTQALHTLNMPHAEFQIALSSQPRTLSGEDAIQFLLNANPGEKPIAVKENASGGELSRLLFAIKTTFAEKNNTPTLIFDEIDANVGGKTATLIGEKLHELGRHRQLLCITHFAQVASHADHHLAVHKEESEGRTFARITSLDAEGRQTELQRMLGGFSIEGNSS
jgi:DNA repair protein RecN (Recombination protein N)